MSPGTPPWPPRGRAGVPRCPQAKESPVSPLGQGTMSPGVPKPSRPPCPPGVGASVPRCPQVSPGCVPKPRTPPGPPGVGASVSRCPLLMSPSPGHQAVSPAVSPSPGHQAMSPNMSPSPGHPHVPPGAGDTVPKCPLITSPSQRLPHVPAGAGDSVPKCPQASPDHVPNPRGHPHVPAGTVSPGVPKPSRPPCPSWGRAGVPKPSRPPQPPWGGCQCPQVSPGVPRCPLLMSPSPGHPHVHPGSGLVSPSVPWLCPQAQDTPMSPLGQETLSPSVP